MQTAAKCVSPPALAIGAVTVLLAGVAPAGPPGVGAVTPRVMRVEMTEFAFHPAVLMMAADQPVRLVFGNAGQLAHQFETDYLRTVAVRVADDSMIAEAPGLSVVRVEPAGIASLEFYPRRRGRFVFACTIEGHREAGMQGILVVK